MGVAVVGAVVVAFGVAATLTAVPAMRTTAIAGLLIVSSALVPVHRLDGARLNLVRGLEELLSLLVGAASANTAAR